MVARRRAMRVSAAVAEGRTVVPAVKAVAPADADRATAAGRAAVAPAAAAQAAAAAMVAKAVAVEVTSRPAVDGLVVITRNCPTSGGAIAVRRPPGMRTVLKLKDGTVARGRVRRPV